MEDSNQSITTQNQGQSKSVLNSITVSEKFEKIALAWICVHCLIMLTMGAVANEFFPEYNKLVISFLNWKVVDLNRIVGTDIFYAYQIINRLEGLAWIILSFLVTARFFKFNKSPIEPIYALAFLIFGISDFVEATMYPGWLGLVKFVTVGVLLYCRSYLIRVHYIQAKVY